MHIYMASAAEKNVMCAQAVRASATHRTPRLLPPHLQYWKSSPRICHVPREHMALSCALRDVPPLAQQGDDANNPRAATLFSKATHLHSQK